MLKRRFGLDRCCYHGEAGMERGSRDLCVAHAELWEYRLTEAGIDVASTHNCGSLNLNRDPIGSRDPYVSRGWRRLR